VPKVLVFDLNETLFEAKMAPGAESELSASVSVSNSAAGVIEQPKINGDIRAHKVSAIARPEMKALFERIHRVHQVASAGGYPSPIAVKLIAAGEYDEKSVKELLGKLYGPHFSELPVQLLNISDRDTDHPSNTIYDERKAALMEKNFETWKKAMPAGLQRSDVFLIDNGDYNIRGAKKMGFSYLHYPTTPGYRDSTQTFSNSKQLIFSSLNHMVDGATQELQKALELKRSSDNLHRACFNLFRVCSSLETSVSVIQKTRRTLS